MSFVSPQRLQNFYDKVKPLIGTKDEITPSQAIAAYNEGRQIIMTGVPTDLGYGGDQSININISNWTYIPDAGYIYGFASIYLVFTPCMITVSGTKDSTTWKITTENLAGGDLEGIALSAFKLANSAGGPLDMGSATQPVYFAGGVPVAITNPILEPLIGTQTEITPAQAITAYNEGRQVIITGVTVPGDSIFGIIPINISNWCYYAFEETSVIIGFTSIGPIYVGLQGSKDSATWEAKVINLAVGDTEGNAEWANHAISANQLGTLNVGSITQPVYFKDGVPVATTYLLNKTVPADAVFTDTTYSAATTSADGLMSAADKSKLDGLSIVDYDATLSTTWSGTAALYTQNVAISGITAEDKPIIDLVPSTTAWEAQEAEWDKIVKAEAYAGGIKFYAKEKTTTALPIKVKVVR